MKALKPNVLPVTPDLGADDLDPACLPESKVSLASQRGRAAGHP
jgi:hypothetical protein